MQGSEHNSCCYVAMLNRYIHGCRKKTGNGGGAGTKTSGLIPFKYKNPLMNSDGGDFIRGFLFLYFLCFFIFFYSLYPFPFSEFSFI